MSSRTSAQSSSKSRKLTQLNSNTEKKLLGYAALAGASGVGILALVQPVRAEVVFTPTHQIINLFNSQILLDLNGDGIVDFSFHYSSSNTLISSYAKLRVFGGTGTVPINQIWGVGGRHTHRWRRPCPPGLRSGLMGDLPLATTEGLWEVPSFAGVRERVMEVHGPLRERIASLA
jgi:hypothetical protein